MQKFSIVLVSLVAALLTLTTHAAEPTTSFIRIYTVGESFGPGITPANRREKPADAWARTGWDITLDTAYAYQRVSGTASLKDKELRTIDTMANITIEYGSPSNTGRCLYDGSVDSEYGCLRSLATKYRDFVVGTVSYDKDAQAYLLVLRRFRHTKLLDDVCEQTIPEADTDGIGLTVAAAGVTDQCIKQMFRNADLTIRNPSNAEVLVDDKMVKQERLRVSAGKHTVSARREGFEPWTSVVECKAETPCNITIALRPKEATPVAVLPPQPRRPPDDAVRIKIPHESIAEDVFDSSPSGMRIALITSGWTTTAVGVSLIITSIFYSLDATEASDEIDAACPGGVCTIPETRIRELYESGTSDEEMSNTLLGVGIGFAVVGTALAITGHVLRDAPAAESEVLITPTWNGLRTTVGRDGLFYVESGISF